MLRAGRGRGARGVGMPRPGRPARTGTRIEPAHRARLAGIVGCDGDRLPYFETLKLFHEPGAQRGLPQRQNRDTLFGRYKGIIAGLRVL